MKSGGQIPQVTRGRKAVKILPMTWFRILLIAPLLLVFAAQAENAGDSGSGKEPAFQPRFAALRFSEINLRTGPGTRYPIEWVYRRAGLPVELIRSFDTWYRIRDSDNAEGWVHQSAVRLVRRGMVTGQLHEARAAPDEQASIAAHLEPGVLFDILSCAEHWCKVNGPGFKGYLRKSDFYGVYPEEIFD